MSETPAGWYNAPGDPPRTQRWWDGEQWVGGPQPLPPTLEDDPAFGLPHPLAGPWWRILARIIDGLIIGIPYAIANGDDASPSLALIVFSIVVTMAYEIGFVAFLGGTPGKLILGLRVMDQETKAIPPPPRDAVMRWLPSAAGLLPVVGVLVALVFLILSLVWLFSDSYRRTVFDRAATTYVVKVN